MLTELIALSVIVFTFVVGFVIGMTAKGFHIHINHSDKKEEIISEDKEYNQSTIDELPEEVKMYYDKTKGFTL